MRKVKILYVVTHHQKKKEEKEKERKVLGELNLCHRTRSSLYSLLMLSIANGGSPTHGLAVRLDILLMLDDG